MDGINNMATGISSNRPKNMEKVNTTFVKSLKKPKLLVGPAMDNPGPILFIVAEVDEKAVIKSGESNETMTIIKKNNRLYKIK